MKIEEQTNLIKGPTKIDPPPIYISSNKRWCRHSWAYRGFDGHSHTKYKVAKIIKQKQNRKKKKN